MIEKSRTENIVMAISFAFIESGLLGYEQIGDSSALLFGRCIVGIEACFFGCLFGISKNGWIAEIGSTPGSSAQNFSASIDHDVDYHLTAALSEINRDW